MGLFHKLICMLICKLISTVRLHVAVLYSLFATQKGYASCSNSEMPMTVQEEQTAQLQAQVSAKERFIVTLRRTITNSGAESHRAVSGYASFLRLAAVTACNADLTATWFPPHTPLPPCLN